MRDVTLIFFCIAAGVTLSGIVANLYRLILRKTANNAATLVHVAVMALAGPNVLFENATRSFRKKGCSAMAYGLALAIAAYWAFMLGLVLVNCGLLF